MDDDRAVERPVGGQEHRRLAALAQEPLEGVLTADGLADQRVCRSALLDL
jgi:hypothetical protein